MICARRSESSRSLIRASTELGGSDTAFWVRLPAQLLHGATALILGWIAAAGGLAVIAHPARYPMTASKLRRMVGEFRELGGVGMEVVSGCHSRNDINAMAGCVRSMNLLASRGSDYHGPENPWVRLGELAELPAGCRPVWESEHWLNTASCRQHVTRQARVTDIRQAD